MGKIHIMDELLSNKIAAGEVVERCMNVVKELVENSIDAKSTEIKIEVEQAGTKLIRVTDNGIGMDKEDAVLCFALHATSKIKTSDDLFNIGTLGFRGEALASIGSVSEITLKTSDGITGTEVKVVGGKIEEVNESDLRKGTTIEVKNLFFNTPARLKHLKSFYTELASITDYVNKISLTHPEIKITLISDNNVVLNTDGSNNLLKNIKCIYGVEVAKRMVEIEAENEDYKISGYISLPEVHRSNKNGMITLVNNRVVRNIELNRTINDSYHSYKPDNRYPIVVLNIEVDPTLVDVNIHPTKMDVKFSKFEELNDLVRETIEKKLKNINLIPNIEAKEREHKKVETFTLNFNINEEETKYEKQEELLTEEPLVINNDLIISEKLKEEEQELVTEKMPLMYPIGEVHGTYIICQNDTGMYIIDQHAAKERINYEICLDKLSNPNNDKIDMIVPTTIEYSNNEYIILKENFDMLEEMNFKIEPFGINSIIVKAHPTWIPSGNEVEAIKKVIEMVIEKEKNFNLGRFRDHVAATMACKMSIKANDEITKEEMERLIEDLRKCKNPFNCPHGRPTIIYYSKEELEKLFKRSGF
ncbi:MAG: DNA mismatch repair endonuclease MutL [Lactobacillales bacterium]|nr:DNA mismatch repair endonuclease MutL [Lactobacillales bacterium]